MIRWIDYGDLFASRAEGLVNPVNCMGVMGKGLALEFKKRFPEHFLVYKEICDAKRLRPGQPCCVRLVVQPDLGIARPGIIMFPTKEHWKGKSRLEWIDQGLAYLKDHTTEWGLRSVAMPQVGCGLGGLRWEQVKPLIQAYFGDGPLEVEVYTRAVLDAGEVIKPVQDQLFT